uniref:Uncharacterized protein LOC117363463 isoform X2 n=1 Tax=Geotrypetes seraphini TaxID=260995 RepID=A0A6P8RPC4_GEOSA|nr:uncharacterized protein LOC117363463 isoform X2 [Geotrypetes seraphini]
MKKLKIKARGTTAEKMQILCKETNENQGGKGKNTLERTAKNILKCLKHQKKAKKNPPNEQSPLLEEDADQNLDDLLSGGKFLEACKLIHKLDETEKDKEILYERAEQVTCEMWLVVKEALFGPENVWQQLHSVMAVVEWEEIKKQERLNIGKDSEPALKWSEQLESHIKEELRNQISQLPPVDKSDVTGIQNHLKHLEEALLWHVTSNRPLEEVGLLTIFVKSFQDCVLSHISALLHASCSPNECIMLYKVGIENYKKTLQTVIQQKRTERNPEQWEKSPTDPGRCQQSSESFDLPCYSDWISANEKKLIAVIQTDIKEKLTNILNSEKKLLKNSPGDNLLCYHFSEIIQVFTKAIEDIQGIDATLTSKVQAMCVEELLQCVSSFAHFVDHFLEADKCSGTWTYRELRVIEDCCILRATCHKLVQLCSAPQDLNLNMEKSINEAEDQGRKCFLQTLSSAFKKLITFAHHRVVVEYLRAFLKSARKLKSVDVLDITFKIDQDGKKIQDIFQGHLNPDAAALGNPLTSIVYLLGVTDCEAMKVEAVFFISNHSDLRKEHLSVILDLNRRVKAKDRKLILDYFKDGVKGEDQQMCFFEEIEVNQLRFASHLCSCCL